LPRKCTFSPIFTWPSRFSVFFERSELRRLVFSVPYSFWSIFSWRKSSRIWRGTILVKSLSLPESLRTLKRFFAVRDFPFSHIPFLERVLLPSREFHPRNGKVSALLLGNGLLSFISLRKNRAFFFVVSDPPHLLVGMIYVFRKGTSSRPLFFPCSEETSIPQSIVSTLLANVFSPRAVQRVNPSPYTSFKLSWTQRVSLSQSSSLPSDSGYEVDDVLNSSPLIPLFVPAFFRGLPPRDPRCLSFARPCSSSSPAPRRFSISFFI